MSPIGEVCSFQTQSHHSQTYSPQQNIADWPCKCNFPKLRTCCVTSYHHCPWGHEEKSEYRGKDNSESKASRGCSKLRPTAIVTGYNLVCYFVDDECWCYGYYPENSPYDEGGWEFQSTEYTAYRHESQCYGEGKDCLSEMLDLGFGEVPDGACVDWDWAGLLFDPKNTHERRS